MEKAKGKSPEEAFLSFQAEHEHILAARSSNEATTRLRAIDTVLFNVLGWDKIDCEVEKYCRVDGYADYAMLVGGKVKLVLEAKRHGKTFALPETSDLSRAQPFGLLAAESKQTADALQQAMGYAASLGASFVGITNGWQWLLTLTFVQDCPLNERLVLGFSFPTSSPPQFRDFFHSFSPAAVAGNEPVTKLLASRLATAPRKLSCDIGGYPRPAGRNQIRNSLQAIISTVWHSIRKNEDDTDFLQHCYVEPEATTGDIEFARQIISERTATEEQSAVNASGADSIVNFVRREEASRPVVILGRVGHGKTTLVSYLRHIRAKKELERYVQITLNFNERPQSAADVAPLVWRLIDEQLLERYHIDTEADNIARGALFIELERFKNSTEAKQTQGDAAAFAAAETQRIIDIRKDRFRYLGKVIHHLKAGQKRPVAIFFDNLDRQDIDIQEAAFKLASAIAQDWNCLVFICLRPETFNASRIEGVLDTVAPKTIMVPRPNIAAVLGRRLSYALSLIRSGGNQNLFTANISVDIPSAEQFFECCISSFGSDGKLVDLVRSTANGNVRNILIAIEELLTSAHLDTAKILVHYNTDGYNIPIHEAQRALILADYIDYDPSASPIPNIFDIKYADPTHHFHRYFALKFLAEVQFGVGGRRLIATEQLQQFLLQLGYTSDLINESLNQMAVDRCLEGEIPEEPWDTTIQSVRITEKGEYLIKTLAESFVYYDLIVVDTPIIELPARKSVTDAQTLRQRIVRCGDFLSYLNSCCSHVNDSKVKSWWNETLAAARRDIGTAKRNAERRGLL